MILLLGCTPPKEPVVAFAASSLSESLTDVGKAWTSMGNPEVIFSFDASSRLAKQIEAGAPADLYISADTAWVDDLSGRDLVGARADLLGNTLVVTTPWLSSRTIEAPADLVGLRLGLAGESVPAGRYARAALAAEWPALLPNVVTGDDVRSVLMWVAESEVDAGVVYATDTRVEPRARVAYTFPKASHPPIVYAGAVVTHSAHAAAAAELLAWCQSPVAKSIFTEAGFTALE